MTTLPTIYIGRLGSLVSSWGAGAHACRPTQVSSLALLVLNEAESQVSLRASGLEGDSRSWALDHETGKSTACIGRLCRMYTTLPIPSPTASCN